MATMPSGFTCVPVGRNGQEIQGCFVDADTDSPSSSSLSINLRIFFEPTQNLGLFRLRATVTSSREPFFLDIPPDKIQSLSLRLSPPVCLDFRVTAVTLIAPKILPLQSITGADRVTLDTLRSLTQQKTLRVSLPSQAHKLPQLTALCEAVGRGLRPDPGQTDLKTLYQGKGGRVVQPDDELWTPSSLLHSATAPSDIHAPNLPPPDLFSVVPTSELHPPTYSHLGSPPPARSPSPRPHKNKKRLRTPSFSSSSSPEYRTWKHLDLAVGDREKMMAELLRRAGNKERTLKKVMVDMDAKCAGAAELIERLTALLPKTEQRESASFEGSGPQLAQEEHVPAEELRASQRTTASVSPSPSASVRSTTSISSNISDHIQAYITKQFNQLREELAENYATNESVEQRVSDEVDSMLSQYVEEHQMVEAIQNAIDEAIGEVRARVLDAWG